MHRWNRGRFYYGQDRPDIVGIAKLPHKAERITVKTHHDRQQKDRPNIWQRCDATGGAGRETTNHDRPNTDHDVEKDEKKESDGVLDHQFPYLTKGRHRIAALAIHHRHG